MPSTAPPATILIVDDNADNRFVLRSLLEHGGHEVIEAHDGAEAVGIARRDPPDLVLMDLDMPIMNGWEAIERLRDEPRTAAVPIIVLSAHALLGDEEKTRQVRCDGFIPKPFSVSQVTRMVHETLMRSRSKGSETDQ